MKIAILGTRGIPNQYGGFEQFAEILSQGLVLKGHQVTVYCSANHSYQDSHFQGVKLVHKFDPENLIGTAGQFIYDLMCMLDARKRDYDIIYMLGYTSNSVWQRFIYKKGALVITNMDGLEWKRSKYSPKVQRFLMYAEKLAVLNSDYLVADSLGIQKYLRDKYKVSSTYIPYGSYVFDKPDTSVLKSYGVEVESYDILIARFEPENNIEMILKAFESSNTQRKLLLVGNYQQTLFGQKMYNLYHHDSRIRFIGAVYDQLILNNLRYFSNLYFHGHSVGGTNPSLLEAMGSSALICFHDNEFNRTIVGIDGFSFYSDSGLCEVIETVTKQNEKNKISNNIDKISQIYTWDKIISDYEMFFLSQMAN